MLAARSPGERFLDPGQVLFPLLLATSNPFEDVGAASVPLEQLDDDDLTQLQGALDDFEAQVGAGLADRRAQLAAAIAARSRGAA